MGRCIVPSPCSLCGDRWGVEDDLGREIASFLDRGEAESYRQLPELQSELRSANRQIGKLERESSEAEAYGYEEGADEALRDIRVLLDTVGAPLSSEVDAKRNVMDRIQKLADSLSKARRTDCRADIRTADGSLVECSLLIGHAGEHRP